MGNIAVCFLSVNNSKIYQHLERKLKDIGRVFRQIDDPQLAPGREITSEVAAWFYR